MMTTMTILMNC